jgi:hypothetical protein
MEEDLILGDEEDAIEEDLYFENVQGYTYTEFISASCDALNCIESGNYMTREDAEKANEIKRLSIEMLHYCVKKMHDMLYTNDIA